MQQVRLSLFKAALAECERLQLTYPTSQPMQSVIAQLEYLVALEIDRSLDRARLKDINIGVIAAHEVEGMDIQVADLLHAVSAEARKM